MGGKHTENLTRIDPTEIDPMAQCNDGSPATYAWKKSPTGSNKWVIFLAGGAACYDKKSCEDRWWLADPGKPKKHLFMSTTQEEKVNSKLSGIFSPNKDESPVWDANKAFLHYCTSDYHLGHLGGNNNITELWNYKFRGQNNVLAMMKHLV